MPLQSRVSQQFLHCIRTTHNSVLQYNHDKKALDVWFWPANDQGERVSPSAFETYRLSHNVLGPSCLCPLEKKDVGDFVESAIYMVGHGRYGGEYVAACAEDQCGYFVFMERIYCKRGVPIRRYALRDVNDPAPPPVMTTIDKEAEKMMLGKRKRVDDGLEIDQRVVRTCPPPTFSIQQAFHLLLKLDSALKPGITAQEFQDLFARCGRCGWYTTRRVFRSHECVRVETEKVNKVIDLTGDEK